MGEPDPSWRREHYEKIDKMILRDAVWTCLFYYKTAIIRQPYVRGINLTELGEHRIRFQEVWFERDR
jgi:MarR-like DNA-binding transcriptional regulator SgrR of sgrS sRNA